MFKTRLYSGRALAIALGVIGMSLILASVVWAAVPTGYSITFKGATYDAGTNKTTFEYEVCSDGSQSKALSHWVLELCIGTPDSAYGDFRDECTATNGATCSLVNPDPTIGLTGVKFDGLLGEERARECHTFTFKLLRNWKDATGDVLWGVKAGDLKGTDTTTGPDCTGGPTAITLSSFAAKSSAGGWASPLVLGLAGLTVLAAGGFFWMKRRAR